MISFYILIPLLIILITFGLIEFNRHKKNIYSIPIRIHINGTRGKSSVTRLVGAGLRAGNIPTITKVTGTFPQLILNDGSEKDIYRKSGANILEQLSIVKFAVAQKAEALVMECMALQPQYQWITENRMIHSTIGVITNVRMDHVDIMGYTLPEIADTLCKTIPKNAVLYTSEDIVTDILNKKAKKQNTVTIVPNINTVSLDEMQGFSYIEHRENVTLALAICKNVGIDKKTALQGMYNAKPDAGVLKRYRIEENQKQIVFYSAFAANDPDSTFMIWNKVKDDFDSNAAKIVLINTRNDRLDRARQLAEMTGKKLGGEIDFLVLMGQSTEYVEGIAIKNGIKQKNIINIGWAKPEKVYNEILNITQINSVVFAIGNMGGMGAKSVEYFENKTIKT